MLLLVAFALSACGGGGGGAPSTAPPVVPPSVSANSEAAALPFGNPPGASPAAISMASKLAPGVNLGNILEAPTDGAWAIPYNTINSLSPIAWNMGFKSVRLPVRWSNHAGLVEPYTIDAAFMTRVKNTVKLLNDQGFIVVMDMHHYRDLDGDALDPGETAAPSANHSTRMVLMWKQIAQEFKDFANDKLVFEVYNEPHGRLQIGQGSTNDPWNALLARAMGQIRATNPDRIVVVGPTGYNNAYNLQHLLLPNDANMIVTVHQYEPFGFTHQGATWITPVRPTGQTCCSVAQQNQITTILNVANAWATQKKYPIYVGEFGAYSNNDYSATMTTQRVNFNNYMRSEMTRLNFSWSYWEMAAGFGVYDLTQQSERTTLLRSLIP
ncbi:MAG: glycoside hydrolase family 5 protein [Brachymonas sp.]|nr:glycoside hydrolase family 5 protein [Brachymonas sp.]